MLKTLLILIAIIVLAAIGAAAALKIMSWVLGALINIVIAVAAFLGIAFLVRKLRSG